MSNKPDAIKGKGWSASAVIVNTDQTIRGLRDELTKEFTARVEIELKLEALHEEHDKKVAALRWELDRCRENERRLFDKLMNYVSSAPVDAKVVERGSK